MLFTWSLTCAKMNLRIRNKNPPAANATVIGTPTALIKFSISPVILIFI